MTETDTGGSHEHVHKALTDQRWELLEHIIELLRGPMVVLSFVWVGLVVVTFARGPSHFVTTASYTIWGVFVLDFLIEIAVAPHKFTYLRRHWLTGVSLMLPALGIFRMLPILRLLATAHAAGYVGLLRVVTSLNRGMGAVRTTVRDRGLGYVIAVTVLVNFVGAAGMLSFESPSAIRAAGFPNGAQPGDGLHGYADALWFVAMLLTSIGSIYWPYTPFGRVLCWFLSLFGLSVFGYITAAVASHFVGLNQAKQSGQSNANSSDSGTGVTGEHST